MIDLGLCSHRFIPDACFSRCPECKDEAIDTLTARVAVLEAALRGVLALGAQHSVACVRQSGYNVACVCGASGAYDIARRALDPKAGA